MMAILMDVRCIVVWNCISLVLVMMDLLMCSLAICKDCLFWRIVYSVRTILGLHFNLSIYHMGDLGWGTCQWDQTHSLS